MIALPPFRGFVRSFVFVCVGVFVLQMFAKYGPFENGALYTQLNRFFGLVPELVMKGMVFQAITWVFLHGDMFHLLFNMLGLWFFGNMLEDTFGTRRFISFCVISAILSAAIIVGFAFIDESMYYIPTIGASGVIFAIIVAAARLYPNQLVVFYIFPMKLKFLAMIIVGLQLFALFESNQQGVSNIAHLGGAVIGFLYISWYNKRGGPRGRMGGDWLKHMADKFHNRKRRKHLRIVYPENRRYH